MNKPIEKTDIFSEETKGYTLPFPPVLMEAVEKEGKKHGRKRNEHLVAIVAQHLGYMPKDPIF